MQKNSKIYVAGHGGLVGSALMRRLKTEGYSNIIFRTREEFDLINQQATEDFFKTEKPEYVFMAAAKVGGIAANNAYPAQFIYENLQVQNNIIHYSYLNNVKKLLFLGSSCIYPRLCPQPMTEDYLMTGPLEPTNEPYALAKIAGIKMCQSYNRQFSTNFISVMPTNLYGPNDNFDLNSAHVLPSLLRRFHEAKVNNLSEVIVWGSGEARREFLYVDDMADGCVFLMNNFNPTKEQNEKGGIYYNLGTGEDVSIRELAESIKKIVGFEGNIKWDATKPDGMPRKLLDVSKMRNLGWRSSIKLEDGIRKLYDWYQNSRF